LQRLKVDIMARDNWSYLKHITDKQQREKDRRRRAIIKKYYRNKK